MSQLYPRVGAHIEGFGRLDVIVTMRARVIALVKQVLDVALDALTSRKCFRMAPVNASHSQSQESYR